MYIMTSLIQNDVSGKPIASDDSVKIQVYLRGSKARKDFDCELADIKTLLAAKGVRKIPFYKLQKNDDGSWVRLNIDDPMQEKIDETKPNE